MIKTITLTGTEQKIEGLGGFNTSVHNLGSLPIYASAFPNITAEADNVAQIPAGAAKIISTTNGTVYIRGTGKAELTGQDHDGVNFRTPPSGSESGGGGDVSKEYVDALGASNLSEAKQYADGLVNSLSQTVSVNAQGVSGNSAAISALQNQKANRTEIPSALPALGGNAATVNGHTVCADVPENAAFTDTTYSAATAEADGLMSASDKSRLDGIDVSQKLDKANPTATGYFVINPPLNSTPGNFSFAGGKNGKATGMYSSAFGQNCSAAGRSSFSVGANSSSEGQCSFANGNYAYATGNYSHAEGRETVSSGVYSHASGYGTEASGEATFAVGEFNATRDAAFVVGNGTGESARADAMVVERNGGVRCGGFIPQTDSGLTANKNANDYSVTPFFGYAENMTNTPFSSGLLISMPCGIPVDNSVVYRTIQLFFPVTSSEQNIFYRVYSGGAWKSWYVIAGALL